MEYHAQTDHHADAGREELPERIRRMARDAKAKPDECAEQQGDREHAEEAPFLSDRREDEIGVRVREVAELLLALSESGAEQLPRPDPGERLLHLPGRFLRRGTRVQKCQHPRYPVLRGRDGAEEERRRGDTECEEMPDARAR